MVLTAGMKSWPFSSEGYTILSLGQRFRRMASEMRVKDPDTMAWLAMMAAVVAMITPKMTNQLGMRSKNALMFICSRRASVMCSPFRCASRKAPCPR